ncbi:hypothetical protein [Paenibacillus wulumuqiensis]|uniref:hypothetical protein n=1 Tax=Paenibacillus wulumuqiensis TaxID=1567107 RepID=UPI0006199B84|nr:hypothetical protein [Paenibacillus wulumuqiensis]
MHVSTVPLRQRIRILSEYIRLFAKMLISNKFSLGWYLLFPNILFFFSHYSWLVSSPAPELFYLHTSVFAAYIIFLLSIDGPLNLIRLRENGALKVFKFISGSKYTVILSQLVTQFAAVLIAMLLFATLVGTLILPHFSDIFLFMAVMLVACIIVTPALSLFFIWLLLLRVKQESLFTMVSILLLLFFLISTNDFTLPGWLGTLTLFVNPFEVARQIMYMLSNELIHTSMPVHHPLLILIILLVYIIVGFMSMRAISVTSVAGRL